MAEAALADELKSLYRISPYYYIHVLDQTTNVIRVEVGPQTFVRNENERVVKGPEHMIVVPPQSYCAIGNPVLRDTNGDIVKDKYGQVKLTHGETEVRLEQEPFPLYPGEVLLVKVSQLTVVNPNEALLLTAVRNFEEDENKRIAGDKWLFIGPGIYIPRKEVKVVSIIRAVVIEPNTAAKIRATRDTVDYKGKKRVVGEQWLVRDVGAYLPGAYEELVEIVQAHVLTEKVAVHVQATSSFTDQQSVARKNGEEWLVCFSDMETYIPDVHEEIVTVVDITTLTDRQYCVICNPVDEKGKPQLGKRKLVKGETSFFLQPGESLEEGIKGVFVLNDNEGLILSAVNAFKDTCATPPVDRRPGDRWMITGPAEYVPPVEVQVVCQREAVPLHENEGIYVRNIKTGQVRSVIGHTYMLNQDEELWNKPIPKAIQELLSSERDPLADRSYAFKKAASSEDTWDGTKVITFQVPHNAAVQMYDYKNKKSRVVFGPDLVMLSPEEQFTQLSLSGGRPKKPNMIRTLALLLGPDFFTDLITVETADHARLQLQIAYNWHLDSADKSEKAASKLFSVPDFVGDACKTLASRIRGAVACVSFDEFHKSSAEIIRKAIFITTDENSDGSKLLFPQNMLNITSVDIQSVEPIDQRTRDALQKSVQLAIEITTKSQEAAAKHEAQRIEQEAKGKLETQKFVDMAKTEKARKDLLEIQASSSAVESCGQAKAEAQSRAEAARIEGEITVMQAKQKTEAEEIATRSELERLKLAREAEIEYTRQQNELEVLKASELAKIEIDKFKSMTDAIGSDTLKTLATAGMDQSVRLLEALGMKSTLITDGRTPINLVTAASSLIGGNLQG